MFKSSVRSARGISSLVKKGAVVIKVGNAIAYLLPLKMDPLQ